MAIRGFRRDGLIAAGIVAVAYMMFFVFRAAGGHDVAVDQAVVQIVLQTLGIGILVAVVSWLVRRFG